MMRYSLIPFTIIFTLIAGCNYSGKLTKRYYNKRLEPKPIDNITTHVDVNAYVIEKEAPPSFKPKTIFDLTEKGQQEVIRQAGINDTTNDKLMSSLSLPLSSKPSNEIDFIDYTKVEKRIIVTLQNLSHMPADRIGKVKVELKIDPEFKILSCNRLTTEYQSIDLGKLNYSNSNQFEISGNLTGGVTGTSGTTDLSETTNSNKVGDASTGSKNNRTDSRTTGTTATRGIAGKFNASRSFTEEVLLKQRIVNLNASISNNTLTLFQESISGIDLSGNILADIIFESKVDTRVERVYSFSGLMKGSSFEEPKDVKVKETLIAYFNFTKDINAELCYEADFRQVDKRHRTITESDDKINLLYGKTSQPKKIILISKDQLRPKLWILFVTGDNNKIPLQFLSPAAGGKGQLIFNSYTDARNFVTWLKANAAKIANAEGKIGTSGHAIFKSDNRNIDANTINRIEIGVYEEN